MFILLMLAGDIEARLVQAGQMTLIESSIQDVPKPRVNSRLLH
jgi:hypothetical protein